MQTRAGVTFDGYFEDKSTSSMPQDCPMRAQDPANAVQDVSNSATDNVIKSLSDSPSSTANPLCKGCNTCELSIPRRWTRRSGVWPAAPAPGQWPPPPAWIGRHLLLVCCSMAQNPLTENIYGPATQRQTRSHHRRQQKGAGAAAMTAPDNLEAQAWHDAMEPTARLEARLA